MNGRTLIVLVLVALLGGAAYVASDALLTPPAVAGEYDGSGDAAAPADDLVGDGSRGAPRRDVAGGVEAVEDDARTPLDVTENPALRGTASRPILEVIGRVVDRSGAPVSGAELSVSVRPTYYQQSPPGGADLESALRKLAAPKTAEPKSPARKAAPKLRTDRTGHFTLRARAYRSSWVELTARHTEFAPTRVAETWTEGEQVVRFGDVVLEIGGTAVGSVVDVDRDPIEGAMVRFVPVPEAMLSDATRGPIAKPGAAPAGKPTGKPTTTPAITTAPRGSVDLVRPVITGVDGQFELKHLPPGPFVLLVDKPRHLPVLTTPQVATDDATVILGRVMLEVGAAIVGHVLDRNSRPIAGVDIEARLFAADDDGSWRRRWQRRRAERRAARGQGATSGDRGNGKAGRTQAPRSQSPRGETKSDSALSDLALHALRCNTKTDEKGAFVIDGLPHAALQFAFRHDGFIDEDRGPVVTKKTTRLDVRMHPRLAITGRLMSAATGRPIESYGIVARRIGGERTRPETPPPAPKRSQPPGSRPPKSKPRKTRSPAPRKSSRLRESAKARAKRLARDRARQAALQKRELARRQKEQAKRDELKAIESIRQRQIAYVRERLGPTGQMPKTHPRPKAHEAGRFELIGLQPGTYVLDIVAPGHVKTAAGPFELTRGQRPLQVTLQAERGVTFKGKVVGSKSGEPIPGAQVELRLPPLDVGALTTNKNVRAKLRHTRTDLRVERDRTGRDGGFSMTGLRPGRFQLIVTARDHREYIVPHFALSSRATTEQTIRLDRAASVRGTVTGREAGETYSVALIGREHSRSARVDPVTGRYEVTTLEPDSYYTLVRSSRSDSRRDKTELTARRKRGYHDLVVHTGMRAVHDLDANDTALGALRGRIWHNGRPAPGYTVQLWPENATPSKSRSRYSRIRATADQNANFGFAWLEPGAYLLEVTPSRERARSSRAGAWHRERIVVSAGRTLDRSLDVRTGDLRFRVLNALTGAPVPSARIDLVAAEAAGNRPVKQWRRLKSTRRATIKKGAGVIRDLRPGRYVYAVSGSGLASDPLRVSVQQGELSLIVRVAPKVKKKPKTPRK